MSAPFRSAPNALSALIQRRLDDLGDETGALSVRKAAEDSHGLISDTHLGNLIKGRANPAGLNDDKIKGIAYAIKVDVDEVYDAANVPRPKARWTLPPQFDRMPESKRRVFEQLIAAMLDAYEQGARGVPWQ